jgi:hypothetical protein
MTPADLGIAAATADDAKQRRDLLRQLLVGRLAIECDSLVNDAPINCGRCKQCQQRRVVLDVLMVGP